MRTQEFINSLLGHAFPMDSTGPLKKFAITTNCFDWEVVALKNDDGQWVVTDFNVLQEVK